MQKLRQILHAQTLFLPRQKVQVTLTKKAGKFTCTVHVFWRSCTLPARYLHVPANAGNFT